MDSRTSYFGERLQADPELALLQALERVFDQVTKRVLEDLVVPELHPRRAGTRGIPDDEGLDLDAAVAFARRKRGERGRPNHGWESLTPTELQVTDLVALGLTNQELSERLRITPKTVKTHLTRIFPKLGLHNRNRTGRHARTTPGGVAVAFDRRVAAVTSGEARP